FGLGFGEARQKNSNNGDECHTNRHGERETRPQHLPPASGCCRWRGGLSGKRPRDLVLQQLPCRRVQFQRRASVLAAFARPGGELFFDVSVGLVWHLVPTVRRNKASF